MNELRDTGFLSNRGRQNAGSYLVHHLNVDWRWGAAWFEHALVDYDPCSNYGNWAYLAGVGNDPRPNRVFDPVRQADMYDADKKYQNTWKTRSA
jgi:deoxyribodipyrimidine photo-lyase